MNAVVGSQYGATTGTVESLIAQLHSQGKLSTPWCENLKIRLKSEILKANERLHKVYELQINRLIPKNICENLLRLSLVFDIATFIKVFSITLNIRKKLYIFRI
jgi:hypothetical protein